MELPFRTGMIANTKTLEFGFEIIPVRKMKLSASKCLLIVFQYLLKYFNRMSGLNKSVFRTLMICNPPLAVAEPLSPEKAACKSASPKLGIAN